ncbi:MAG: AMED_5909 family protein [Pseudonocardiaceae bacterium]
MQAHEELVGIRPERNASLAVWKAFYERSVALYREIAEIDRGHHHEALYWADREQEKLDEITARIKAKNSDSESAEQWG